MDKLHYQYKTNSNQLLRVTDEVVSSTPSDYHDVQSQPENNYAYDGIGNLVRDTRENITGISWSVYGKILQVTKTVNSQTQTIGYSYDAAGNRISKQVNGATTYYVRDAGGNTMAVYTMGDNTVNNGAVTLQEQHLYGSSRLGIQKPGLEVSSLLPAYSTEVGTTTKSIYSIFERGKKFFELSNHLGNVLATVSDKKYLLAANSTGNGGCAPGSAAEDVLVSLRGTETMYTGRSSVSLLPGFESSGGDNFEVYADAGLSACNPATDNSTATSTVYAAEVVSAQDYAPFGMELVGRQYNASSYRYGFNGKENDNEVKGEGNQIDYGMRIYDPRLGRFLSIDPLTAKYPDLTTYGFAANSPIWLVDKKGEEPDRNQAGTIEQASAQWSKLPMKNPTVKDIYNYIQTNPNAVRYIYTKDKGWIDLQHYFGTLKYGKTAMDLLEPASGNKILQDQLFGPGANESYYSYEDLPSNQFASEAKNLKEKTIIHTKDDSGMPTDIEMVSVKAGAQLISAVKENFQNAGTTSPENAPNWKAIPFKDHGERKRIPEVKEQVRLALFGPSGVYTTSTPVYFNDKEKMELLQTGKFIPQNHSSTPYNLNNFPAAQSSLQNGDKQKGATGH